MRVISQLAAAGGKATGAEEVDDGFGKDDSDWDVYKKISKVAFIRIKGTGTLATTVLRQI
jgi:hypothetical protein